ncbi:OLC1v1029544C1 [Oldenlandia corymbosa var. corymbosa]|uniref:OLC1v1029544C1 n=1 Tax=Oldenlandia corymbosa var. corymbosa TaxID=529605 RepID=A0AAV1CES2_OLDCO|nr:OLC1v1029544C1 [Oldenlandia corymbosa var. corymbosa]
MELSLANKPVLIRKPQLLKDYLLDDLSSCSSSGFRSYPRRQCCTSVRFLLEVDLKNKPPRYIKKPPQKSPLKPPPSAFQRASAAVINTFKSSNNKLKFTLLPRSLSRKLLKRSFWKKSDRKEIPPPPPPAILRVENPIAHSPPSPQPPPEFVVSPVSGDSSCSTSDSNCKSKSNSWSDSEFTASSDICSGVNNNNNTSPISTPGNSTVEISNKALEEEDDIVLERDKVISSSGGVGVLPGGDDDSSEATPTTTTTAVSDTINATSTNLKQCPSPISSDVLEGMQCPSHEDVKQHFSPVSVLDCPFDDDDEVSVSSSPFQHRLARMEGTKKRLLRKIKKFERLTELQPLNLEKRIIVLSESDHDSEGSSGYVLSESDRDSDRNSGYILSEYDGDSDRTPPRSSIRSRQFVSSESDRDVADSDRSPPCHSSESSSEDFIDYSEDEENQATSDKSFKLLQLAKSTMPSFCSMKLKTNYDKLLMDFFKEGMEMEKISPENAICVSSNTKIQLDHELVAAAKDWITGQPRELYLGWEVPKNRETYMRDMERDGTWRRSNEEKQEVATELEVEVFATMMKELCHDLLS